MEPKDALSPQDAKARVLHILRDGIVAWTKHARAEMAADALTESDCMNVLRGGWVDRVELTRETWRYRVVTQRMAVVIAFRSGAELVVVTAWRFES